MGFSGTWTDYTDCISPNCQSVAGLSVVSRSLSRCSTQLPTAWVVSSQRKASVLHPQLVMQLISMFIRFIFDISRKKHRLCVLLPKCSPPSKWTHLNDEANYTRSITILIHARNKNWDVCNVVTVRCACPLQSNCKILAVWTDIYIYKSNEPTWDLYLQS